MTPEQLSSTIVDVLQALVDDGAVSLPDGVPTTVVVERPRSKEHGDYATNVALQLAKPAGLTPRDLAGLVAERLGSSEGIAGIEYNGDCWVLRAVLHRLATTVDQTNTSFFIQLELNGLARVGTSPLDLLKRSVPGYVPVNDPLLMQRDRTADPLPEF